MDNVDLRVGEDDPLAHRQRLQDIDRRLQPLRPPEALRNATSGHRPEEMAAGESAAAAAALLPPLPVSGTSGTTGLTNDTPKGVRRGDRKGIGDTQESAGPHTGPVPGSTEAETTRKLQVKGHNFVDKKNVDRLMSDDCAQLDLTEAPPSDTVRHQRVRAGQLNGHTGSVSGCIVLEGGTKAISWASGDKTLRVWDLGSGTTEHELTGHTGNVKGCIVLEGGTKAISWSGDKTLRVWDVATGSEISSHRRKFADAPSAVSTFTSPEQSCYLLLFACATGVVCKLSPTQPPELPTVWRNRLPMGSEYPGWLTDTLSQWPLLVFAVDANDKCTLVQKLARGDHGSVEAVRAIVDKRGAAGPHKQVLTGLAVRTGILARYDNDKSPLSLAMRANNEELTQLLLDDYLEFLALPTELLELPQAAVLAEADIVELFRTFPAVAVDFVKKLKLRAGVFGLATIARCDFANVSDESFLVRGETTCSPWLWPLTIHSIWSVAGREPASETQDTAWGVALKPSLVPLSGCESNVLTASSNAAAQPDKQGTGSNV